MKIWRKLVAVLVLVCLMVSAVPAVLAAGEEDGLGLDFSELEQQIGIANGLNSYDYTKESWAVLRSAVETGNQRLEGGTEQSKLDKAAEDIELAIEELVKMDYSPLLDALDLVYAKIDEDSQRHDVWYRLDKAVDKARPLLVSGDQQAVNEMAVLLKDLLEEISNISEPAVEPEIIIQEVEVEVPPTTDFCNIPRHRMWPVLFVISLVLNVAMFAAFGYILFKRKRTEDTTPMVNYDIDDDMDD